MKNKRILITLLIIFALIFALIGTSFAASSFSATLTPDSTRVQKGNDVTVTLKLSGINVEGGISSLSGTLKYDSDVLTIKKEDIKASGDWAVDYNEDNSKIVFDRAEAVTSDEEVATFKFKVNSSTSATTAAIQLVSIKGANSGLDEAVSISDITTNISIGNSIAPTNSPSSKPSNSPSNKPSNSPSNSPSSKPSSIPTNSPTATNGNQTTIKEEPIPNAGSENYVLPLMGIIAVLGIVSFVNYKRIENK